MDRIPDLTQREFGKEREPDEYLDKLWEELLKEICEVSEEGE